MVEACAITEEGNIIPTTSLGNAASYVQSADTVIVEDLHPGNIWMTGNSNVVIIDAYYRFNSPGLGLGGKFIFG